MESKEAPFFVKAEKGDFFSNFDQLKFMLTLLLYILILPVKKNNTSVMVLPQQKYYNKIIGNVVQKIAFKAH